MKKHFIVLVLIALCSIADRAHCATNMRKLLLSTDSLISASQTAVQQGEYTKAIELGEYNVKLLKKEIEEDHEYKAKAMLDLAHSYAAAGNWEQAWKNANSSASMLKSLYSSSNGAYAMALSEAAYYNARRANYSYAKNDATKALELYSAQNTKEPKTEGKLLSNLAFAHFLVGEYTQTKDLTNKAVSLLDASGAKNTTEYASALSLLAAATSRTQSAQEDAIAFANTALAIQNKLLAPISFDKAVTLSRLSLAYMRKADTPHAIETGDKAIEIWDSLHVLPVEYEDCAWQMATLHNANGQFEQARKLCSLLQAHAEATGAINSLQYANLMAGGAQALHGLERYDEAAALQEKSIAVVERVKSKDYASLPSAYNNLGIYYLRAGKSKEAIKAQTQAVKICEKTNKNQPKHAEALSRLASTYAVLTNYPAAADAQTKANDILAGCHTTPQFELMEGLNNLAAYQFRAENYTGALSTEQRIIDLYRAAGDTIHKNFATAMANAALYADKCHNAPLAIQYQRRGLDVLKRIILPTENDYTEGLTLLVKYCTDVSDYTQAAKAQQELAELSARIWGAKSQQYASHLELLATLLSLDKQLPQAIAVQEQVAEIYNSADIDEATRNNAITQLATLHSKAGNYDEASRLSSTVAKSATSSTEMSPEQAEKLMAAASHQQMAGNHAEALRLSSEALNVLEHTSAKGSRQHANALSDLAGYYALVHNNEFAINYATQAAAIYEQVNDTINLATALNNLALFYARAKDATKVDSLSQRALHLAAEKCGERSAEYARILNNVASNRFSLGSAEEAEPLGNEAIRIFTENGLDATPEFANLLNNQSVYLLNLDRQDEALSLIDRAIDIRKTTLGTSHPEYLHATVNHCMMLSSIDGEEGRLTARAIESTRLLTDMLRRQFTSLPAAERSSYWNAWNNWYRNDLLNYAANYPSPELISAAYEGTIFAKGLMLNSECNLKDLIAEAASSDIDLLYTRLQGIRAKLNDIYERSSAPGTNHQLEVTDSLERAANQLERQLVSASSEYGDYTANLTVPASAVREAMSENEAAVEFVSFGSSVNPRYYAFVVTPADSVPQYVEIASAEQINAMRNNRTELSRILWGPVAAHLPDNVNALYFAPAGELYSLPIEYLPDFGSPGQLIESRWQLHRVSSTRQLARRGETASGALASVIGGIEYNTDGTPSLYDLPQTLLEARDIHQQLSQKVNNVTLLTGARGSETAIRELSGKRTALLHIATHGFCISEEDADYQACDIFTTVAPGESHGEENMLRRSGLMLHGAAPTLLGRGPADRKNDGVLTAMEIAQLDLRGLDLAVLSACQTALGDVTGEGVFGLQRGFKKAGAKSLLMSLWKVDDTATRLLMNKFYANLCNGMNKGDALKDAQSYLRSYTPPTDSFEDDEMFDPSFEDDVPSEDHPYDNPQFWAAFVLLDAI